MNTDMNKLITTIKTETVTKDKTSFAFIGYLILLEYKGMLLSQGLKQEEIYKYLHIPKQTTKSEYDKNVDFQAILDLVDYRLTEYKTQSVEFYNRVKKNWDNLGLQTIKREYKNNPKGMNKIFLQFNHIEVNIQSVMDLYEGLNQTDKTLNDFFTPTNVSNGISKLLINLNTNLAQKEEINIYDCACGIGKLFYPTLLDLKEKYPNKIVNIYGIDMYDKFAIFTQSIFSLINFNHTHIVIGNSLQVNPFNGIKMDLVLGNPPFKQQDYGIDIQFKILKYEDTHFTQFKRVFNSIKMSKGYKEAPLITEKEYFDIVGNYKII